eukprot:CAMPEP_0198197708 /NCGR_PEP_ID=MMETSP1445-20131203/1265_1 /TAXON_ID=36898 /ORGANISM="Pyramimonas sp., Strain CCMP2087" /LENGTH=131 /DNA_ID=CAMNT_0043867053 /DNA_START=241 /DNA_END=632 /DNA_ORIENTATION=+
MELAGAFGMQRVHAIEIYPKVEAQRFTGRARAVRNPIPSCRKRGNALYIVPRSVTKHSPLRVCAFIGDNVEEPKIAPKTARQTEREQRLADAGVKYDKFVDDFVSWIDKDERLFTGDNGGNGGDGAGDGTG